MKEIKFRAWDKEKNKMSNTMGLLDTYAHWRSVMNDDEPLWMQFTGLLDRNGKEIYEGDVLRFTEVDEDSAFGSETTYVTEVKWIDDLAQWRVVFPAGRRTELHCVLQIPCFYDQEIIGNIYENPELLSK